MSFYAERQWDAEIEFLYECDDCEFVGDILVNAICDRFSATASFECPECGCERVGVEVRGSLDDEW